jgi:hypothetical protein
LNKRVKEIKKEMGKKENMLIPLSVLVKKIISYEKLVIPRLKIFEEICISSNE